MKLFSKLAAQSISVLAKRHGMIDPVRLLASLSRFSRKAKSFAPLELLRAGAVLHSRGLLNTAVFQQNLDWVLPYWVNKQFSPQSSSFIPRGFAITHINTVHRNWTAVGIPSSMFLPIVDPRGMLMPAYDSWSVDCWVLDAKKRNLLPSQMAYAEQSQLTNAYRMQVCTKTTSPDFNLSTVAYDATQSGISHWGLEAKATMRGEAKGTAETYIALAVRPFNPEGFSAISKIEYNPAKNTLSINGSDWLSPRSRPAFICYAHQDTADIPEQLSQGNCISADKPSEITCKAGMATAALLFAFENDQASVELPLKPEAVTDKSKKGKYKQAIPVQGSSFTEHPVLQIEGIPAHYKHLLEAAQTTLMLFTGETCFAGPYTYKRFWYRDCILMMHALLLSGKTQAARKLWPKIFSQQNAEGYFESQDGEWDSNGQVLWMALLFELYTEEKLDVSHMQRLERAARWIITTVSTHKSPYPETKGMLPAGFSAEHFGPNDYYFWDNFWAIAGLDALGQLYARHGDQQKSAYWVERKEAFAAGIETRVRDSVPKNSYKALAVSPLRRMDSAAVGNLVARYPLQITPKNTDWLDNTASYLYEHCCTEKGFFHAISHGGINPYLTLHLAQVFLEKDPFIANSLAQAISRLASPTGHWPEAMHPEHGTGVMGDGHHGWASAEWICFIRNCIVFEDVQNETIVIGFGLIESWFEEKEIRFVDFPIRQGQISGSISKVNGTSYRVTIDKCSSPREIIACIPGTARTRIPVHKSRTIRALPKRQKQQTTGSAQ